MVRRSMWRPPAIIPRMGAPQQQADTDNAAATQNAHAFITRWQGTTASELSTAQSFVTQLCELLDVDAPPPHARAGRHV